MKDQKFSCMSLFVILVFIFCTVLPAYSQSKLMTERECVLTEGGEVIWDLRSYQWVCCIPTGEDLEDCVPITDKARLPKTSVKPLPKRGSKVIVKPQDPQGQTE
jgi:hypothetical protein